MAGTSSSGTCTRGGGSQGTRLGVPSLRDEEPRGIVLATTSTLLSSALAASLQPLAIWTSARTYLIFLIVMLLELLQI